MGEGTSVWLERDQELQTGSEAVWAPRLSGHWKGAAAGAERTRRREGCS